VFCRTLDGSVYAKLGNFGYSHNVDISLPTFVDSSACDQRYLAPEVMEKGGVTSVKSDVWSFGILIWVIHYDINMRYHTDDVTIGDTQRYDFIVRRCKKRRDTFF
jgi:serine/threonine protein kinase